jgi:hypothetical protein
MDTKSQIQHLWRDVEHMSEETAVRKANAALADPRRFECEKSRDHRSDPKLPPLLNSLASRIARIRAVKGEAMIDLEEIQESELKRGFYRIGTDSDFTELIFMSGDDRIVESDGSATEQRSFPSIFHWIVFTDILLNEDALQIR